MNCPLRSFRFAGFVVPIVSFFHLLLIYCAHRLSVRFCGSVGCCVRFLAVNVCPAPRCLCILHPCFLLATFRLARPPSCMPTD
jgi:hypothetical protein